MIFFFLQARNIKAIDGANKDRNIIFPTWLILELGITIDFLMKKRRKTNKKTKTKQKKPEKKR